MMAVIVILAGTLYLVGMVAASLITRWACRGERRRIDRADVVVICLWPVLLAALIVMAVIDLWRYPADWAELSRR